MVLKSRASIVPVMVRLVTVVNSVEVRAADKPPTVIFTVLETAAFACIPINIIIII